MTDRLLFCKTPLQSLILSEIQKLHPARDTIIYQPNTRSPKHRIYFDMMTGDRKELLEWIEEWPSHLLQEIRSYFSISRHTRKKQFDEYFVSSVGSVPFALLKARREGVIKTFDDGMFNLLPSEILPRLTREPPPHRLLKRMAGAPLNRHIIEESVCHYSIFDPQLAHPVWKNIVQIELFRRPSQLARNRGGVTVLLGTFLGGFADQRGEQVKSAYRSVLKREFDIFIPHPADSLPAKVATRIPERPFLLRMITERIAEDVILQLEELGYDVRVYGIASTALVNVAPHAKPFNIIIPGLNDAEAYLFERLGVPPLHFAELDV